MNSKSLMPVVFVPHGGGPMPLLGDASHRELTAFMQNLAQDLPAPAAILVVSAHWEEAQASISSGAQPAMIFDYYGFPPRKLRVSLPGAW